MSQAQSLQKKLQKGGLIDASAVSREEAIDAAQAAGMTGLIVHCDRARSRSAVLRAVVKAVDFPEFFGGNLDALYDCLCDTLLDHKNGLFLWFDKLHSGDPALTEDAKAIVAVCVDVAEFAANNDRRFAFAVEHAGKHPDPEPGVVPTPYSG
ncbi:barstar family protein [Pollutimonas thiosulfatoxidans]|uniref:Barstar family protein 2 n=1 Tax=Pollutimonas thiosulfatoxidans TaxID=2028345 RepID=A0A410G8E5_9BURK|nr:barstar family protein [Pollutimonas thiosulfatoxidans]MBF6618568.1 barstar family protein [Candidimonas sp.]NYT43685.1 barstar family protein [Alcaligenaceae bacterium]QAA92567.1 barstar family protein 2 [Pollutimonas thiosulfatoxidans]